jgi:hypothetical protein
MNPWWRKKACALGAGWFKEIFFKIFQAPEEEEVPNSHILWDRVRWVFIPSIPSIPLTQYHSQVHLEWIIFLYIFLYILNSVDKSHDWPKNPAPENTF